MNATSAAAGSVASSSQRGSTELRAVTTMTHAAGTIAPIARATSVCCDRSASLRARPGELARRLIAAVARPLVLSEGTKITPSISVGIAHSEPGAVTTSLLREADAALYRAKSLGTDQPAEQVVKSTIAMAHALGILTTAEGVETAEQLDRLAELDCDIAQGFLIGHPASARDALARVGDDGHWHGPGVPAKVLRPSP